MRAGRRSFGAFVAHDGVCLVEYQTDRVGARVVDEWADAGRSASLDEALERLSRLLGARDAKGARLAIAIEQFGVQHHVMMLPDASNDVLEPIVRREVQRTLGLADPGIAFARGRAAQSRKTPSSDAKVGATQIFIAAAPRDAIGVLRMRLAGRGIEIDAVTVVPKAIHSLFEATGAALEPTAVLVCLEGGPHLAFFLDGRLEVAVDPPIALEGERASVSMVLDQVERGAVYFRQQFRGAVATRVLLAARPDEYTALASALEQRLGARVKPLFAGAASPEGVVAMGAVIEARHANPLDLFPHPPTLESRVRTALRGPNGVVAATATIAAAAGIWAAVQVSSFASAHMSADRERVAARMSISAMAPMRLVAERRADAMQKALFVANSQTERTALTNALQDIAERVPAGIRFDSLRVSRAATGWTAGISGQANGVTAAQAVGSVDAFYRAIRAHPELAQATLDQFEYPTSNPLGDSTRHSADVIIQFHLSFNLGNR